MNIQHGLEITPLLAAVTNIPRVESDRVDMHASCTRGINIAITSSIRYPAKPCVLPTVDFHETYGMDLFFSVY